ncbi:chlP, partial [Symbiodinium necroappetens]
MIALLATTYSCLAGTDLATNSQIWLAAKKAALDPYRFLKRCGRSTWSRGWALFFVKRATEGVPGKVVCLLSRSQPLRPHSKAMAAFVAVPSSATSTALRGSLQHVPQAPPSPAPAASLAVKGALGVAAVGAAVAAGTRRKHRSALAGAATVTKLSKTRSLADAKVVVCAGAMLPEAQLQPDGMNGKEEGRKLRVAVIGGGPAGASTADALAQEGIETYLIERKLDNCKPCGGAIPLCMIEEFDLPKDIVDRQVRKMTMISPTNKEVQIGQTLKDDEFIGMVRREVLDDFLRQRAKTNGATLINGLFMGMTIPQSKEGSALSGLLLCQNDPLGLFASVRKGEKKTLEVDVVVGADGANSRVAKDIDAGDYEYAIAFQERMRIPDGKMDYYKDRAEMYVGDDVSPDFYAWVFPKCDH